MGQTGNTKENCANRYGLDAGERPGSYPYTDRDANVEGGNEYVEGGNACTTNGILGGGPDDPFSVRLQNREAGAILTAALVVNIIALVMCYVLDVRTNMKITTWIALIFIIVCRYISYSKGYDYIPINQVAELNALNQQYNEFDAAQRRFRGERVTRDINGNLIPTNQGIVINPIW